MPKIHVLDKAVYEIIAAGEVVDRPAAVMKELIENALDSGATKITAEIKNGGRTYIRVTDNGCGMSPEDVPLAFVRHATSKVSTAEDLNRILTLGFRGEALAAISAVAKVEVLTKAADSEVGFHYVIEGADVIESCEIGCPDGTTFIVKDLFFNTPARQKFMRKDVSESNYISDMVQKLALSHPDVSFKFIRDNRSDFITSGDGKLLSCIYVILGKEFYSSCIPVDNSYCNIKVTGFISKPLFSFSNRASQIFFVNSRYIKSVCCQHALAEAYNNKIMTSSVPECVLNIEIDPSSIDINCHPSKLEVKFSSEQSVFNAVVFAVKNSLMLYDTPAEIKLEPVNKNTFTYDNVYVKPVEEKAVQLELSSNTPVVTASDYENDAELGLDAKTVTGYELDSVPTVTPEPSANRMRAVLFSEPSVIPNHDERMKRWNGGLELSQSSGSILDNPPAKNSAGSSKASNEKPESPKSEKKSDLNGYRYIRDKSLSKSADAKPKKKAIQEDKNGTLPMRILGEAFKTFIIAERGEDIIFIDKHAAHERYIYKQIKSQQTDLESQMLIEPINVHVSPSIYESVSENLSICRRLGLEVEPLPCSFLSISAVPAIADDINPIVIVEKIGEAVICEDCVKSNHIFDDIYKIIACKAAIKAQSDSDKLELEKIIDLVTEEDLRYCPHGRPILIKLSKNTIYNMFKRS